MASGRRWLRMASTNTSGMPFVLNYSHGDRLAVAEVTGLAFIEDAGELVERIARQTLAHGDKRLLINLLDVVGTMERHDHEHLGKLAFAHLGHLEKVASLVPEDKITRVSQQTAISLGMQLRVFTSVGDAIEWLVA